MHVYIDGPCGPIVPAQHQQPPIGPHGPSMYTSIYMSSQARCPTCPFPSRPVPSCPIPSCPVWANWWLLDRQSKHPGDFALAVALCTASLVFNVHPYVSFQKVHKEFTNFFGETVLDRAADKRKNKEWLEIAKVRKNTNYVLVSQLNPVAMPVPAAAVVDPKSPKYQLCLAGYKDIAEYLKTTSLLVVFLGLETVKLTEPRQTFADSATNEDDSVVAWFAVDASGLTDKQLQAVHPDAEILSTYPIAMNLMSKHASIFGQARSVMAWHNRYEFCPTCGASTTVNDAGYKRTCTNNECRSLKGNSRSSHQCFSCTTRLVFC